MDDRIDSLMESVGFSPMYKKKYPHEFSGGQRQRIGIAKAISVNPEFVVCDEPVSALDVSVQAQVLNLMKRLKAERKLSYLFISHDLSVIRFISDRVGVMYAGRIVELAETKEFFSNRPAPLFPGADGGCPQAGGGGGQGKPVPGDRHDRRGLQGGLSVLYPLSPGHGAVPPGDARGAGGQPGAPGDVPSV